MPNSNHIYVHQCCTILQRFGLILLSSNVHLKIAEWNTLISIFKDCCGKCFTIAHIFPRIPCCDILCLFSCSPFFLSIEKQQQKSLSPGSVQCILLCECWIQFNTYRTLCKCIIFTFSKRGRKYNKCHYWKNLTPCSSLHLMNNLTPQSVTYFTFWRIGSVLLSITVCFLQMFLCEKATKIFRWVPW